MNRLYHEKQASALCGVHCLNTLLQHPQWSEIQLSEIALRLDEEERAVMQGEAFVESANVSNDGMFSIQVIQRALAPILAIPLDHPDVRSAKTSPGQECAFICNLNEHWFTIRSVRGQWWNFNSLFPAPQPLGTFYLAAFIEETKASGYDIFVIRGNLPQPSEPSLTLEMTAGNQGGRWLSVEESKSLNDEAASARLRGKAMHSIEAAFDLANAAGGGTTMTLPSSAKRQRHPNEPTTMTQDDEDPELAAAIAASLGGPSAKARDIAGPSSSAPPIPLGARSAMIPEGGSVAVADEEDADLMRAIALSLKEGSNTGGEGRRDHEGAGPSSAPSLPLTRERSAGNSSIEANAGDVTDDEIEQMMTAPYNEVEAGSSFAPGVDQMEVDEEADLARAIAASLVDQPSGPQGHQADQPTGPHGPQGPQASSPSGLEQLAGPPSSSRVQDEGLTDEPESGPDVISLAFNLPTIGRVQRLFLTTRDKPATVYKFLRSTLRGSTLKGQVLAPPALIISRAYPRMDLNESDDRTLGEIGFQASEPIDRPSTAHLESSCARRLRKTVAKTHQSIMGALTHR